MYRPTPTSVQALRAVGFTVVGQTNTPQLGMGVRTEGTHNPWDIGAHRRRVQRRLCGRCGLWRGRRGAGHDTGGSIRIPAALCGVVGFRPSAGTVSRRGVVQFSSTFDQVSPVASTVALTRAASEALWAPAVAAGHQLVQDPLSKAARRVLGVPWSYVRAHTSAPMLREFERVLGVLEGLGFHLTEVELEPNEVWLDLQREVRVREAGAVHQGLLSDRRVTLSRVARATLESGPAVSAGPTAPRWTGVRR